MLRIVWRQHWVALSVLLTLSAVAVGALVLSEIYYRGLGVRVWRTWAVQAFGPNYPDLAIQAIPLLPTLFVGGPPISPELAHCTPGSPPPPAYCNRRPAP